MKLETQHHHIDLPDGMRGKLQDFRRRVRIIKIAEGIFAAIFGLALSYCLLFVLDRFWDTPPIARWLILIGGALGLGLFLPLKLHRWFWGHRRLEQVARLLRKSFPRVGDQLLGIIELANNDEEQERSQTLVVAAMGQVDEATRGKDFSKGVPNPRHRRWAFAAIAVAAVGAAALYFVPAAGWNAFFRWSMPWRDIDRYTFAQMEELPERMVVPYAERFKVAVGLLPESEWKPKTGAARYLDQTAIRSTREDDKFAFDVPPQRDKGELVISVGDDRAKVTVEPTPRPELISLKANIDLPGYLEYSKPLVQEARSGSLSVLKGSQVKVVAGASRELSEATLDGKTVEVAGAEIRTPPFDIADSRTIAISWLDTLGLAAKEPLDLDLVAVDDEAPTIQCRNTKRERVVLDSEVVTFEISTADDFGVKRVGLEWEGLPDPLNNPHPQSGEKLAAAGAPEIRSVDAQAAFSAKAEGIDPQALRIRGFVEDFLPDRERVYSAAYTLYVLNPEDHAIWIAEQLDRWRRQSLEVYERELQLNERNEELRALDPDKLDEPDTRRDIERQAAAERGNARQLSGLTDSGEELIQQAARNPEFEGKTLEKWAETLQALKDIADNRMPSVADLLRKASDAAAKDPSESQGGKPSDSQGGKPSDSQSGKPSDSQGGQPSDSQSGKPSDSKGGQPSDSQSGQPSDSQGGKPSDSQSGQPSDSQSGQPSDSQSGEPSDGQSSSSPPSAQNNESQPQGGSPSDSQPSPPSQVPSVSDTESSLAEPKKNEESEGGASSSGSGKLTLPSTSVPGGTPPPGGGSPAGEALDKAVKEQRELLDAFAKVAEELNEILRNLEGSTFVKRLKAASRYQMNVAGDLNRDLLGSFGVEPDAVPEENTKDANSIADRQAVQSDKIYQIEEDLEAYAERMQDQKFNAVLDQMKESEIVGEIAQIGRTVSADNFSGQSIATSEFWADTLDRWADELLGPEEEPGPPPPPSEGESESLPPELVLEVMRILQEEIELRDSTRSLNQARPALAADDFETLATPLALIQGELAERTDEVVSAIAALPGGAANFGQEMALLQRVTEVMQEAEGILGEPDTGPPAIAAETEAIELLLQAKRAAGGGGGGGGGGSGSAGGAGGGGGGNSPGGGGEGTTDKSALALVGVGSDAEGVVKDREVGQSTGVAGESLPAEFQNGLDAYFNALEKGAR